MALILASQSPRRKVLMGFITTDFTVDVCMEEEKVEEGTPADQAVQQLALQKAKWVAKRHPGDVVIGCDTVVAIDGEILGKPKSEEDAANMLRKLSGKKHQVYTGVALVQDDREECFVSTTGVKFYELEDELVDWYVATGEPADKAGAYGIQGNGSILVEGLEGDYFTVMGLPVGRLYRELKKFMTR
jgi:septum formation protein